MNIRTIPVSAPYNPVAHHILQRDEPTQKEISAYKKAEYLDNKEWQSIKHLSSEEIEKYHKTRLNQHIDLYQCMEYMREIPSKSYILAKRSSIPVNKIEPETLYIPFINIGTYPLLTKDESAILYRHFLTKELAHEHIFERSKDSLRRQIDTEALMVINAAVKADHSIATCDGLEAENIDLAFSLIDQHELPRGAIVMHPFLWRHIEYWDHQELTKTNYDIENQIIGEPPIWGYYKKVPIYVCTMCPKNAAYVLSKKEYVGVLKVVKDIKVYENEYIKGPRPENFDVFEYENIHNKYPFFESDKRLNIEEIEAGWTLEAEMGFGVVNDYAVARIQVHGDIGIKPKQAILEENYHKALAKLFETQKELEEAKKTIIYFNQQAEQTKEKSLGSCADQSIYKQETPLPLN